jgi:hypothetical protein
MKVAGGAKLMQERQARQQIVHERLRAVWLVGITARTGSQASKVNRVAKMDALMWLPAVDKL